MPPFMITSQVSDRLAYASGSSRWACPASPGGFASTFIGRPSAHDAGRDVDEHAMTSQLLRSGLRRQMEHGGDMLGIDLVAGGAALGQLDGDLRSDQWCGERGA